MKHLKYFAVGLTLVTAISGLCWIVSQYPLVILSAFVVFLIYIAGKNICEMRKL